MVIIINEKAVAFLLFITMDSSIVQSQVHENDEHYPHNVASQQVTHDVEVNHFDNEKKSVLNKVKAKAKKIKETIKKHGHQVLDRGQEYNNRDHDLDEDEEMTDDPEVHEAPIHESETVKTATPTSEQVENLDKSEINFGGTRVMGEEPHHDPKVLGVSSTTDIDHNMAADPAKTFSVEEKAGLPMDNLERPTGLEKDPHIPGSGLEAYTPPNRTQVTDPIEAGQDEIEITPVEESFLRMNVHDEPKPTPEPNVQPSVVDSEYPPAGSHDQFVPHLSAASQTQYPSAESHDLFSQEKISTNTNKNPENVTETEQTLNTFTTTGDEEPRYESSTDKVVSHKDVIASEIGSAEEGGISDKLTKNEEPRYEANTDEVISPKDVIASEIGSGEKGDTSDKLNKNEKPRYEENTDDVVSPQDVTASEIGSGEKGDISNKLIKNEEPGCEANTDKAVSPQDVIASEIGSGEKGDISDKLTKNEEPRYEANTDEVISPKYVIASEIGSGEKGDISDKLPKNEEPCYEANTDEAVSPKDVIASEIGSAEKGDINNKLTKNEEPRYEADIDKVVSPKDVIASEIGSEDKGDINDKLTKNEEQQKNGDASNMSGSTAEYGKTIAQSLTEKLGPVYEKVAGVGSAVKSKVTGTSTGGVGTDTKNGVKEHDRGVSVKDYLAEKLRPGEEDKALSEVMSEALQKPKEEPVNKEYGQLGSEDEKLEKVSEENRVNSPGKGVVDRLKGVVGSWFGKSEENQSTQVAGGENLSKNANSGAEVEQVSQVVGENKSSPIEEQRTG